MSKLAIRGGTKLVDRAFPTWPVHDDEDEKNLLSVLRRNKWWMYAFGTDELAPGEASGEISQVEQFEREFARAQRVQHCLTLNSGSSALEVALEACGIGPGDEVITTPYTFIATSSCIFSRFALPVYVDVDPETYNIDATKIEAAITPKTRAILPVYFGGEIADMDAINAIAKKHNLRVIEDAAQAQGAILDDGRAAGGLGDIGCFSFQESKIMTAGEGGACTTNDDALADLIWSYRHCGRQRDGGAWYEHHRIGHNFRMTDFQGTLLRGQLRRLKTQCETRMANFKVFCGVIESVPGITPFKLHPKAVQHSLYLPMLRYDPRPWEGIDRARVVEALDAEGAGVGVGYGWPNYKNPVFQNMQDNLGHQAFAFGVDRFPDWASYAECCPVAERACKSEAIWMPHEVLEGTAADAKLFADCFVKVYENRSELMR
jgi:dTDP-4-amino-4,6-dideoxygalactose transaminase